MSPLVETHVALVKSQPAIEVSVIEYVPADKPPTSVPLSHFSPSDNVNVSVAAPPSVKSKFPEDASGLVSFCTII